MTFLWRCTSVLVLVTLVSSHTIKSLVEECKKTVPISDQLEQSFLELRFPPEEKTSHCLMHCIGDTLELFDDEDGANTKNIRELLMADGDSSGEELDEEQKQCIEEAGKMGPIDEEDECFRAFRVYLCFEQQFLELLRKGLEEEA